MLTATLDIIQILAIESVNKISMIKSEQCGGMIDSVSNIHVQTKQIILLVCPKMFVTNIQVEFFILRQLNTLTRSHYFTNSFRQILYERQKTHPVQLKTATNGTNSATKLYINNK